MVMEYEEYAAILKAGGQPAMQEYTKQFVLLVEGNLLPKYSICDIIEENFMLMPKETQGAFLYMMTASRLIRLAGKCPRAYTAPRT